MKLHLGCGQKYLKGYVNIDYPQDKHTVQIKSVADELRDIKKLTYQQKSIEEIRLHHVFEHFSRVDVCVLLSTWNNWLLPNGVVHIEVPDFGRMMLDLINPAKNLKSKGVAFRHVFGSQEAEWAVHFDGYTKQKLTYLLTLFGFGNFEWKHNHWHGTHNIEVIGYKVSDLDYNKCLNSTTEYLQLHLVDNSESEKIMLRTWRQEWEEKIKLLYGK